MPNIIYENHSHKDPNFPIIFHLNHLTELNDHFLMHYHESIELLFFLEGNGLVSCETNQLEVAPNELVIINSNQLHAIYSLSSSLKYYCLIIDKSFCESFSLLIGELFLHNHIKDPSFKTIFSSIAQELSLANPYYKSMIKTYAIHLLIDLCREYTITSPPPYTPSSYSKVLMVKKSIAYIKKKFLSHFSIDDICEDIGISKYYLCRIFKEITGQTLLDYTNLLRCEYARKLLYLGTYNVSEVALQSGFNNLSYFSKTYKKYMGKLPSAETIPKKNSL
ncbi:MAG: AraC family transcriptional regulator [Cellulosilyticaceae bacterium]